MRFCLIEPVESRRPSRKSPPIRAGVRTSLPTARDIRPWLRLMFTAMDDPIIQRIERFCCSGATLCAERRNRGYTLTQSGALAARLRPPKCNDRFEVLYWSLWKNRWASTGPFGRTVLSIEDALGFIAYEDMFRVMT
jgi:hypothetical protein